MPSEQSKTRLGRDAAARAEDASAGGGGAPSGCGRTSSKLVPPSESSSVQDVTRVDVRRSLLGATGRRYVGPPHGPQEVLRMPPASSRPNMSVRGSWDGFRGSCLLNVFSKPFMRGHGGWQKVERGPAHGAVAYVMACRVRAALTTVPDWAADVARSCEVVRLRADLADGSNLPRWRDALPLALNSHTPNPPKKQDPT